VIELGQGYSFGNNHDRARRRADEPAGDDRGRPARRGCVRPDDEQQRARPRCELDQSALELTAAALDSRVGVDCYLDAGNPVRRLVEFAARTRALLLVVGANAPSSGRPPSIVASGLSRAAPCPVVVVPEAAPLPELDNAKRRD